MKVSPMNILVKHLINEYYILREKCPCYLLLDEIQIIDWEHC